MTEGRWLWGLLLWLCSAVLWAAPPLILNGADGQRLGGHLGVFLDSSGDMTQSDARRALAEGRFRAPHSSAPGLGYAGQGAWWVHAVLFNPGKTRETRWLEQAYPLQYSSILYLERDDGRIERMDNGVAVPVDSRPMPTRQILFPLQLDAGEKVNVYIRLSGVTQSNASFTLWKPADYVDFSRRYMALKYLAVGASVIVVMFAVLAWEVRRRPGLLFGAAAAALTIFVLFLLDGLAMDWFPAGQEDAAYRLRNLVVFLTLACDAAFTNAILDLPRHAPRLARRLNLLAWLALALGVLSASFLGNLLWFHVAFLGYVLVLLAVGVYAAWRRLPYGRLYLLAWGLLWASVVIRSLIELGALHWLPLTPDLITAGFIACSLVISAALYLDIRSARANADASHQHYLRFQVNEKERLAAAVEARTRELREAKAQAEEASRAKTTFLSEVSHELRSPLNTILGYAHLLARESSGEAAAKLQIIIQGGDQLVRLIDDVLAFSRGELREIETVQEPMSLSALVAQVEQSARLQAEQRGNHFSVQLAPGLPSSVLTDEQRLLQVLHNLIGNACKFTQLGEIRLLLEPEQVAAPDGMAHVRFSVEDTGIGIAAEDQERIFAPFCRIRHARRQPGIGLGLAIARQLVRALGGEIHLRSAPGRGSRFWFTLPLRATRLDAPASHDPAVQLIRGHKGRQRTLLIADDLVDNQGFMRQLCVHWGFATVVAGNGNEALAACLRADPPIDLVLVDQYMPDADGWAFLRALRADERCAGLPVILMSAAPAARPAGFPEGVDFDGALMKPLQTSALAQVLAQRLDLEWIRSDEIEAQVKTFRCDNLSQIEIRQMRDALKLGKVLNLQRHAAALALTNPECADFAQEVVRLCGMIDLAGLQRLFDQSLLESERGEVMTDAAETADAAA